MARSSAQSPSRPHAAARVAAAALALALCAGVCSAAPAAAPAARTQAAAQAPAASASADQLVSRAIETYQRGNVDAALPLLELAEKRHPFHRANSEVLFLLGNAYLEKDKTAEAEAAFNKLLTRYGKYATTIARVDDARIGLARVLTGKKEYDQAITTLKAFLDNNPRSQARDAAFIALARAYTEKGDFNDAKQLLEPVAGNERSPMRDPALYLLAELAAKQGDNARAEKIMQLLFNSARDKDMKNRALFFFGDLYRRQGNIPKAIEAYRRIKAPGNDVEARTLNAGILFEIAQTYEDLKHPLEARVAFEGVAFLYPDSSLSTDALHRAILTDADYGDFENAERSYLAFLKNYPGSPLAESVRLYLAQKLMEQGRHEDAIRQLASGLKEFPTGQFAETTFHTLGLAYLNAKQYEKAERTLNEFAGKFAGSPLVPESYFYIAEAYGEQKLFSQSISTFEKVAADFPGTEIAAAAAERAQVTHIIYGDHLLQTNEIDDAVAEYRKVTATNLVEQARIMVCQAYMQGRRFDEAREAVDEFMKEYPTSPLIPQAKFSLAEAQMQSEEYKAAEETLRSIIALDIPRTHEILPAAQLQVAFCRYYQDDPEGMSNALATVVGEYAASPEAGEALYWLGYLMRSQRAYASAARNYERIVSDYQGCPFAHEAAYLIGECYVLDNQPVPAIQKFLDAFTHFPDAGYTAYALIRGAELYLERAQIDGWLGELDKLAEGSGKGGDVLAVARAAALQRAGKLDDAAAALARLNISALPPELAGLSLAVQAAIENGKGQYAAAAKTAAGAAAVAEQSKVGLNEALYQLARAYYGQKDWTQAADAFRRLIGECVIPNAKVNAIALLDLAHALTEFGDMDDVVKLCDDAVRLRPGPELTARSLILKGDAMMKVNEYQKAAQYYQRATILYGKLAEYAVPAFRGLITAYTKLGLTEDAGKTKQEFAQRYPDEAGK